MPTPIDRDHALDLFAGRIARLGRDESDDAADIRDARALRRFEAGSEGDAAARRLEEALRERIGDRMAALPPDLADRLAVIAVECRTGACRILIAESSVDFTAKAARGEVSDTERVQGALFALASGA